MVNDVDKRCRDGTHDYKCCACIEQSFYAPESINNPLRIQYFRKLVMKNIDFQRIKSQLCKSLFCPAVFPIQNCPNQPETSKEGSNGLYPKHHNASHRHQIQFHDPSLEIRYHQSRLSTAAAAPVHTFPPTPHAFQQNMPRCNRGDRSPEWTDLRTSHLPDMLPESRRIPGTRSPRTPFLCLCPTDSESVVLHKPAV